MPYQIAKARRPFRHVLRGGNFAILFVARVHSCLSGGLGGHRRRRSFAWQTLLISDTRKGEQYEDRFGAFTGFFKTVFETIFWN